MLCVRQTLTEILLDVTNDEILAISRDTIKRFRNSGIESLLFRWLHCFSNWPKILYILIYVLNKVRHYFKFNGFYCELCL